MKAIAKTNHAALSALTLKTTTPPKDHECGGAHYLLHVDWLPKEDQDESYETDFIVGIWRDNQWWSLCDEDNYEELSEYTDGSPFRLVIFVPLDEWWVVLGYIPLWPIS